MRKVLLYLVAYIAWFVASVGGIAVLLLARAAINQVALFALLPRTAFRLLDQVSLLVLGLVGLVLLIVGESYFREAVERRVLGKRILTVAAIEAGLAAILYMVPVVLVALL
jgi:hypothetical protein